MGGIGEVIDLLGLPGMKALGQICQSQAVSRGGDLLRKPRRVARKVERFGGDDTGGLVVPMVFPGLVNRTSCTI